MIFSTFSGLGAEPSKPDFAFPKTVSSNAETDLKAALKAKNGPATLDALIRFLLAQTAINPENTDKVVSRLEKTESEVKDSVTCAMIKLLRAGVQADDSLALSVWTDYASVLRRVPVGDWKQVVVAEAQFFPTLYDFAAARAPFSTVAPTMRELYADRPLPALYWNLHGLSDFEAMVALFNRMEAQPESAYVLARLSNQAFSLEKRKRAYELTRQWMKIHELSPNRSEIEEIEAQLCAPSLRIDAESVIGLGRPLSVKVNAVCLSAASIRVERVKGAPGFKPYRRQLRFDGSGVFEADTSLELTFNEYGVYRLTPVFDGQSETRYRDFVEVTVTDILLWREQYGSKGETFALDAINGAPQSDVRFSRVRNMISAERGNDRFTPAIYGYDYEESQSRTRYSANILTDRGLYHPGDSVRFVGVVMAIDSDRTAPAPGRKVEARLYNANYQPVDTLNLVSDEFGRVSGSFPLPSDGLTGNFHVELVQLGSAYFMVTDYKAPTFEVTAECERLSDTSVRVSGSAIGFNGFPIADAEVKLAARTLPRWVWWRDFRNSGGATVATDTVRTDAEGCFSTVITIPADESLSVTATAASPTGETQQTEAFVPAMPYFISAQIPQYFVPGRAPQIQTLNARGEEENIPFVVELTSLADGTVVRPDSATWANVPSGAYSVLIRTEEPAFALPFERDRIYIYRPDDKMPPAEMALFVPVTKVEPGSELLVGSSFDDSHILKTLWDGKRIISQEWLSPAQGNFKLRVELPDSVRSATLSLATLRDYRTESVNVHIERPDVSRSLRLKFSSFRDRMVPGERERWSISVTDNLGAPARAAVVLDVYSKALDAIVPFGWNFYVPRSDGKSWNLNNTSSFNRSAFARRNVRIDHPLSISAPQFNLYGREWPRMYEEVYYGVTSASGGIKSRMMMKNAAMASADVEEDGVMADLAEDTAVFGAAEAESAVAADRGNGSVTESDAADSYRLPEVPVALWAPVLTTAPDGSLQVEFEAPDANTTWKLMCQAYNLDLLTGSYGAEIVAAKPVMVQPNLPRFLRVGDRTELRALVMNASDSVAAVESFIEIFDPVTSEIIARREFNAEIPSCMSETVAFELTAPDRSMIGVRVRATSGNFTDGEQSVIAILPAVITASSATPLFFAADSTHVTVEAPRGSVVQLTTNAAWECVTALPGLAASESKSAFSATSALFSAAVGRGLVRSYPQIAAALKRWEDADSVLISKLSRNEDLKIALLSQTPWPAAAQSDTERMARLLLLLDRREADRVIDSAVDNLARLVRKGGLGWTPDSEESSQWVTEEFLSVMARLRRLGYMPSSAKLDRIISDAVKFLDGEVARDYAKYKGEYPLYAELRPQFPEIAQSAPARRAQAATVQYLVGHWRDLDFTSKAQAALVLNSSGYQSTARTIIESLRQYEAWRQTGLNAILLDAFAAVEPRCAEVDEIRQFFIERKQAMEWGDGLSTSNLIASILTSGSPWLVPAANEMSIRVNGEEVNPGVEAVMGSFRLDLAKGGTVELYKGQFPAWGGVFTSLTDTVTSVPAFGSEKLSVSRRLEGDLTVGSRVKLIIEIDAAQPLDYVVVRSPRAAGLSVVDQLPGRQWLPGSSVYREPCATETNWFFSRLKKGKTVLTEEFFVTSSGEFLLAPAEAQSQYAPEFHSRSAGEETSCSPRD